MKKTTESTSFWTIFKDNNDWNEKSIIGFMSFAVMVLIETVDVVTGYFGQELVINDYIFNAFAIITLGSFGISGAENIMGKKTKDANKEEDVQMEG
jgi:hypothetical protein